MMKLLCFESVLLGAIPESLGGLTNLEELSLFSNQLSGTKSLTYVCVFLCHLLFAFGPLLDVRFKCFNLIVSTSKLLFIDAIRRRTRILGRSHELDGACSELQQAIRYLISGMSLHVYEPLVFCAWVAEWCEF